MPASKRYFTAIELPAAVKDGLGGVRHALPGFRWLRPEQLHLTLVFVGGLPFEQQPLLEQALGAVRAGSFRMQLQGRGRFPARGQARVLWVAARSEPETALNTLHQDICGQLQAAGLPFDRKPLRPHVTVARSRHSPQSDALQPFLQDSHAIDAPFAVSAFVLFSSRLLPEGARYTEEARFELE